MVHGTVARKHILFLKIRTQLQGGPPPVINGVTISINGLKQGVTGVITPINGVLTLLTTGDGAHLVRFGPVFVEHWQFTIFKVRAPSNHHQYHFFFYTAIPRMKRKTYGSKDPLLGMHVKICKGYNLGAICIFLGGTWIQSEPSVEKKTRVIHWNCSPISQ